MILKIKRIVWILGNLTTALRLIMKESFDDNFDSILRDQYKCIHDSQDKGLVAPNCISHAFSHQGTVRDKVG